MINKSMRKTIHSIDAFLNNEILGYIVLDDDGVYLYTDDDKIKLNQDDEIKIVNNREYIPVSYDDVLNVRCDFDMPLYAGRDAFVKKRDGGR